VPKFCRKISFIYLVLLSVWSLSLEASPITMTSRIEMVRDHADDLWGETSDYLTLTSSATAGNCKTSGGKVVVRIPSSEERSFSIALAAQLAGKEVQVSVDDTRKDSGGYCIIRYINIVN
jgi:hypothetical protein